MRSGHIKQWRTIYFAGMLFRGSKLEASENAKACGQYEDLDKQAPTLQ